MPPRVHHILAGLLIAVLLVATPAASARCPKGQTNAGDIVSPSEQMVPIERAGRVISVSSLEVLCTGDRVIARETEVVIQLSWREDVVVVSPGKHYLVPGKRQVFSELLAGAASFFFQRETRAGEGAVTLAPPPQGLRFDVQGLESGAAHLSALPDVFAPPISRGTSEALAVHLRDPAGRTHSRYSAPGDPPPVFLDLPKLRGTWTVEAESVGRAIYGSFVLDGGAIWKSPRDAEDAILLWICEDPTVNGLEGVHELRALNGGAMSPRAKAILTYWNERGSRSFCAGE